MVLHEYQKYCVEYLIAHPYAALFLEPGLGKTVITLTAIDELMFDRFEIQSVLVVCPLRVARSTWGKECEKWEHLRHFKISKILGTRDERLKALRTKADIYIINRENVSWLVKELKKNFFFDMVVLDELSSFKNDDSRRFKAIKCVRPMIKRIVGLTGTPAPNGLEDLWAQVYLLDKGERLGYFIGQFRKNYLEPDKRDAKMIFTYKPRKGAVEAVYDKLSDICVSMKSIDYIKMPERIDNFVEVEMSNAESKQYQQLERDALLPFVDGDIDAVNAAALTNKLLQMANGAVYDENRAVRHIHDRKLEALEDLVEAANGKPVLVFYAYLHDKERLFNFFKGTARSLDSDKDISDWNDGKIPVAIAHPASCGHGLNLQDGGSIIIWFGLTWSLELYLQANARLYRQGQKETVVVHHIICKGTVDELVMKALVKKDIGQAELINALKARIKGV